MLIGTRRGSIDRMATDGQRFDDANCSSESFVDTCSFRAGTMNRGLMPPSV